MPSTAEEFRKRARTKVTLPSGLEVEIRKLHLWDFMDLDEIPVPSENADVINGADQSAASPSREMMEEARRYSIRAIVKAAIRPKFSEKEGPDPAVICIEDLDDNDFQALAEGILNWMKPKKDETKTEVDENG